MIKLKYPPERITKATAYVNKRIRKGFRRWAVTREEWLLLHDTVIDKKPTTVLEIGSFVYTSTLAILKAMNHNGLGGSLTSVDIEHRAHKFDAGDVDWTRLTGESQKVLPTLKGIQYDLIFIDGEHGIYGFSTDLVNSLWLIKDGGTIVFHDSNGPNIKRVADRIIGKELIDWYCGSNKKKGIAVYNLCSIKNFQSGASSIFGK